MRKFVVAATLTALTLLPAGARAGFLLEASLGKGAQVSPKPSDGVSRWEQMNLEIAPGYSPSLPVLSMFRLQLGIVMDFADKSASKTNMELRPMISLVPPVFPLYGRVIFGITDLFDRVGKREILYGGALGVKVGLPGIAFVPALGIFVEAGLLPRSRDTVSANSTTTESKMAWIVEGRAGAYINF